MKISNGVNKKNLNLILSFLFLILIFSIFLVFKYSQNKFLLAPEIKNQESTQVTNTNISPISGLICDNWSRRPMAVMLAGDNVARPLSGLAEADLVFEMPVITGEITRLMAIFVCGQPKEIGSLRSARHDFITLALAFDAIYVHWGGSHFAYEKLNKKVIDNLDALPNPYNAFYRKSGIQPPHNGFTSMEKLTNSAKKLNYRLEGKFEEYLHENPKGARQGGRVVGGLESKTQIPNKKGILKIEYPYPYNVEYQYNPETNSYLRWRGGKPEIDKNNNQQIEAENVVIMRTKSYQIEGQYNTVEVEGSGQALVYQNGQEIKATWQKDKSNQKSKLYFFDENKQEIKFIPGQIWIEVIEPDKEVKWEIGTKNI